MDVQLLYLEHTLNLNFYNPGGVQNLLLIQLFEENLVDHQLVEERDHTLSIHRSLSKPISHKLLFVLFFRKILPQLRKRAPSYQWLLMLLLIIFIFDTTYELLSDLNNLQDLGLIRIILILYIGRET
jgi:hypothetical protein